MKKRKVCQWLLRMDPPERVHFGHYLRSPLHSHRPQLADMLNHLEEWVLSETEEACSPEAYWERVYPGKAYNGNLLSRLLSEMLSELKGFLALRRYQADPAAQQINLLREYRHRGWQEVLPRAFKEVRHKLDTEFPQDEHYYYNRLQLAIEKVDYDSDHLGKDPEPIYQDVLDQLDSFFLIGKLKYYCNAVHHDRLHSKGHHFRFQEIFALLKTPALFDESSKISLFYLYYKTLEEESNRESFEKFLSTFLEIKRSASPQYLQLSEEEDYFFLLHSINKCTKRLNQGEENWIEFYTELNNYAIIKGFLNNGEFLGDTEFINIAGTLGRFKRFQDSEKFIAQNSPMLRGGIENAAYFFALGMNAYYRMDFEAGKTHFLKAKQQVNSKSDISIPINSRAVLCRIWYELEDFEAMEFELNSYRVFLNRIKHYSKSRLTPFLNFCKTLQKINRTAYSNSKHKKEKLKSILDEIKMKKLVSGKSWLLSVLNREIERAA